MGESRKIFEGHTQLKPEQQQRKEWEEGKQQQLRMPQMAEKLKLQINGKEEVKKKEEEEEIVITHYVNPELFAYITMQQLEARGPWVNKMEAQLAPHCQPQQQLDHYALEEFVIVRFAPWERTKFLRGLVKLHQRGKYIVWAIDYGITINCRVKDMWKMPKHLCDQIVEINWGGVADVAPSTGTKWSKLAVRVLQKCLENCTKLHYRINRNRGAEHSLGELSIDVEPSLDAADYLLEQQCAIRQERRELSSDLSLAYDMELAEQNDADIRPSKHAIRILRLMWGQQQQNPNQKRSLNVEAMSNTSMTLSRLDALLQTHKMLSVPQSAQRLSVVKNRNESSVETALFKACSKNSSSSKSSKSTSHDSNCSDDSFKSAEAESKPAPPRCNRNILDLYRRPIIPGQPIDNKCKGNTGKENETVSNESESYKKEQNNRKSNHKDKPRSQTTSAKSKSDKLSKLPNKKESLKKVENKPKSVEDAAIYKSKLEEPKLIENGVAKKALDKPQLNQNQPRSQTASMPVEVTKLLREVYPNGKESCRQSQNQSQTVPSKSKLEELSKLLQDKPKIHQKKARAQSARSVANNETHMQVLTHSSVAEQVLPMAHHLSESLLCPDVQKAMIEMDLQLPMATQRYAWPHLMLGNSCVLIDNTGRGRSWSYLPALCSLVMQSMRDSVDVRLGPLALLLADSAEQAGLLSNHCNRLMKFYQTQLLKVLNTHEYSTEDVQLMLLNSCGILVTTTAHLKQLLLPGALELISPRRLKYFVMDDYDRIGSELKELLPLLYGLNLNRLQLMLVAQQWHSRVFLELINRLAINPLLLFGDFLKAAIYGNLKLGIALLRSDKKLDKLICYLKEQSNSQRRTAIYCKHGAELAVLREALTAAGFECIGASDAAKQQVQQLLLLTDALPCRNLELMVHYSLPETWTKFSQRFQGFSDNIANCLCPEEMLEKRQRIMSYVMLDESNSYEFPRLVEFLHKHDIKLDEQIYKMVSNCRRLTDQNRAMCPQLLSKGECNRQMSCSKRHFAIDDDLQHDPCGALGQRQMLVRCKLLKICSPVHYVVISESYSSDGISWQSASNLSQLRKLSTELYMHMSLKQNRRVQQKLSISDICVLQRHLRYQRVRVVDLSDRRLVTVQLMDEGTKQLKVKPSELFECEQRFKAAPSLAMDVRLCGLSPALEGGAGDSWQAEATKWVNEALAGLQENQQLQLTLAFSMFHVAYARELTVLQECPTMRTSVKALQLSKELIRRGFARHEEESVERLYKLFDQWQQKCKKEKNDKAEPGKTEEKSLEEENNSKQNEVTRSSPKEIELNGTQGEKSDSESDDIDFDSENTATTSQPSSGSKMKQFLSALQDYLLRRNKAESEKAADPLDPPLRTCSQEVKEKTVEESPKVQPEKASDALEPPLEPASEEVKKAAEEPQDTGEVDRTSVFLDLLLQDLSISDQTYKDSTKQMVQELLGTERPLKSAQSSSKKKEEQTSKNSVVSPGSNPSYAIYCGIVAGNAVRPKVRWHQTLMQIELIFEQQVPQYELLHQRNVLIYQVNETSPPQRCILNLLGEVSIVSEKQHGYQLHVKLAKQGLTMYWPTLLSSLTAQQHSHWLIYDTERGKLPTQEKGHINWLRYERNQYKGGQQNESDNDDSLSADEESDLPDVERADIRGGIFDF